MASRVRGNVHARFRVGENLAITSKSYLSLFEIRDAKDFEAGLALFLLRDLWLGRMAIGGEKSVISDAEGEGDFYVDSFARLWGENSAEADGWITLRDAPRKLSMEIPCDDGGKKFYGLTTRNYIDSDAATGLSGYVDYRFVAIESAWDGD